jgi:hypothetical protein
VTPETRKRLDELYALRDACQTEINKLNPRIPAPARIRATKAKCGTDSGYYRHLRQLNEPACQACREAHAQATRIRAHNKTAA